MGRVQARFVGVCSADFLNWKGKEEERGRRKKEKKKEEEKKKISIPCHRAVYVPDFG